MADISIRQQHSLSHQGAKAAAQEVAEQMARDFDMALQWDGNVLLFQRSGVSGALTLLEREALLEIRLGFLMKAFAARIEEKVAAKMERVFAAA